MEMVAKGLVFSMVVVHTFLKCRIWRFWRTSFTTAHDDLARNKRYSTVVKGLLWAKTILESSAEAFFVFSVRHLRCRGLQDLLFLPLTDLFVVWDW
ncbi:hypothetical protein VNO80_29351 [Phaseolus coccineus]|uniref:Uncharacterized protein n=1 Tax=Phaseolus coccineus TaxID=3886 RepID=A0AAN9QIE5_PHACN